MSYTKRRLEDLNILDDFLMSAVASDEEVGADFCRTLLSVLLQRQIGEVQVTAQKTLMPYTPEMHGIRMDVEVKERVKNSQGLPSLNVYDVEPHLRSETNFPKHNRFYQARIDSRFLKSGERDFSKLPDLFILTITDYDPFGEDYMIYTVCNGCKEVPGLEYADGLVFYYFNTKGKKGGTPEIQAMLKYIMESTERNAVNEDIRRLHRCVGKVKTQPEVRDSYMHLSEVIEWEKEKSREEGREEGRAEGREEGRAEGREEGRAEVRAVIGIFVEILQETGADREEIRRKLTEKYEITEETAEGYLEKYWKQ